MELSRIVPFRGGYRSPSGPAVLRTFSTFVSDLWVLRFWPLPTLCRPPIDLSQECEYTTNARQSYLQTLYSIFTSWLALLVALSASVVFAGLFYFHIKTGYFDDTFIYLHMAWNAVNLGTLRYFPTVSSSSALLASSPLHMFVLVVAALLAKAFGYSAPTLFWARLVLYLGGIITPVLFLPFFRSRLKFYVLIITVYFLLSCTYSTVFEFEGGLLYFWVVALMLSFPKRTTNLSFAALLPLGVLIRPDMALVPYVGLLASELLRDRRSLWRWASRALMFGAGYGVLWSCLAVGFGVYPIPISWWTKASVIFLFSSQSLLQVFATSLGQVWASPFLPSDIAGWSLVLLAVFALAPTSRRARVGWIVAGLVAVYMFSRMPSNFWWYYQNIVVMLVAIGLGAMYARQGVLLRSHFAITAFTVVLLGVSLYTNFLKNPPLPWDFAVTSRAQTYEYLGAQAQPNGTYILPKLGRVIIRNPEIGMIAYFGGRNGWMWDVAGLAQPLPGMMSSSLRFFYPTSLRHPAASFASQLARRTHAKVVDVWAMGSGSPAAFQGARKACNVVIPKGFLCVNYVPPSQW